MGPKQTPCPNPLFIKWLEEWKREAEERESNQKWTYAKAIKSIKKYPLPLRSGKEATILENIGDGIAKRIDQRLKMFLQNGGDLSDLHYNPSSEDAPSPPKRKKKQTTTKNNELTSPTSQTPVASPKRRTHKYIPKYRSGAYALLIALYYESQKLGFVGFLKKAELQKLAQPLTDKSMTIPDAGSHYTAWSSMGNLIEKGLICKYSNPAKYSITDSGCDLAKTLLEGLSNFSPNNSLSDSSTLLQQQSSPPAKKHTKTFVPHTNNNFTVPSSPIENLSAPFQNLTNNYPDTSSVAATNGNLLGGRRDTSPMAFYDRLQGKLTNNKNNNSNNNNPDNNNSLLGNSNNRFQNHNNIEKHNNFAGQNSLGIRSTENQRNLTDNSHNATSTSATPSVLNCWYVEENGACTTEKSKALVDINESFGFGFLIKAKQNDLERHEVVYDVDKARPPDGDFIYAYVSDAFCEDIATPPSDHRKASKSKPSSSVSTATKKPSISDPLLVESKKRAPLMQQNNLPNKNIHQTNNQNISSTKTQNVADHQHVKEAVRKATEPTDILFTMQPGLFDIYLCVDVVETMGSGRRKQELADKLVKSGIKMDTRKLKVGDFLWIAKEKFGLQREVVLDFIIERKRMDDLSSSICDGRFREQKFRMKSSGLKKKIYLIEQFGSNTHYSVPEETLQQAIMNCQVIEKFVVKETNDIYDSANYLVVMTTQITSLYKDRTIHAVSMETYKQIKTERDFEDIVNESEQYFFTFDEFHECMDKNKMLSVREMFCKQLMQLKGMTADRALAVTSKYSTPVILVDALSRYSTQQEKESLFTSIEFGKAKRKFGAAMSKQIVLAYDDGS